MSELKTKGIRESEMERINDKRKYTLEKYERFQEALENKRLLCYGCLEVVNIQSEKQPDYNKQFEQLKEDVKKAFGKPEKYKEIEKNLKKLEKESNKKAQYIYVCKNPYCSLHKGTGRVGRKFIETVVLDNDRLESFNQALQNYFSRDKKCERCGSLLYSIEDQLIENKLNEFGLLNKEKSQKGIQVYKRNFIRIGNITKDDLVCFNCRSTIKKDSFNQTDRIKELEEENLYQNKINEELIKKIEALKNERVKEIEENANV